MVLSQRCGSTKSPKKTWKVPWSIRDRLHTYLQSDTLGGRRSLAARKACGVDIDEWFAVYANHSIAVCFRLWTTLPVKASTQLQGADADPALNFRADGDPAIDPIRAPSSRRGYSTTQSAVIQPRHFR